MQLVNIKLRRGGEGTYGDVVVSADEDSGEDEEEETEEAEDAEAECGERSMFECKFCAEGVEEAGEEAGDERRVLYVSARRTVAQLGEPEAQAIELAATATGAYCCGSRSRVPGNEYVGVWDISGKISPCLS